MKNSIFLLILFLAISCIPPYVPEQGRVFPTYNNPFGAVSEADVNEAVKLKKKYPENTEYIADYVVNTYTFDYYADNLKKGNPIGVKEETFEKYTSLTDFVKLSKLEYFNDQINFDGFFVKYGSRKEEDFIKRDYVISNFQSRGIFFSDARQAQIAAELNVTGTNLRLNFSRYYKDAKYLTSAYFLEGFPQKEKVITFAIPNYLNVEIIEKNFEGFNIEKSDKKYVIKDEQMKGRITDTKSKDKLTYITYILKDVKGIRNEKLMPGYSHNLPHIIILVKSLNTDMAKAYSKPLPKELKEATTPAAEKGKSKVKPKTVNAKVELKPIPLIANTNDLYAHYAQIVSKLENDSSVFIEKVKSITKDKATDLEKIEAIFYWVQDNIRYVAYEDGIAAFKPDACQNVYNNRYGDCKGMANLLKSMISTLGYDARLTWIGTKHLNYDYNVPSIVVDNHMICTVILNEKKYYLDGTESYIGIDDYADRIQGRPVMVQNGTNYSIDTIPDLSAERNLRFRKANFTFVNNGFEGKMYETIKGENKTDILRSFHNAPLAKKDQVLFDVIDPNDIDIEVKNVVASDLTNRRTDIDMNYDLRVSNHMVSADKNIMFKPDYNREFSGSKADSARFFDIQFDHKLNYAYDLNFAIPAGYKVVSTPQNLNIDNAEFSLIMKYENAGNAIRYTKSIILKKGKISKSNFTEWNKMIDQMRVNYNQYIVLSK
ncbi:MAG: transglutaminase domain-containing protein [Candidatus Methylacidiphilales bacterium]